MSKENFKTVENHNYKNFVTFLNQPSILIGTRKICPAESLFYAYETPDWLKGDYSIVSMEKVHETENDEWSSPISTVWKVVFKETSNYLSNTKSHEKTAYFSFNGYYRSHEGSEYTDWSEVTPKTITKEVYE